LGTRKPEVYGALTLAQINAKIRAFASERKARVRIFQSNCEGRLIDHIFKHKKWADWLIINPGALTHYSYALRDAVEASSLPTVEVHISDISRREPFRRKSVLAPVRRRQIKGLGWRSYLEAVSFCGKNLKSPG